MGTAPMSELDFEVAGWLGASVDDPLERATLAALRITAGPTNLPVTEVEDTIARTVRTHVFCSGLSCRTMAACELVATSVGTPPAGGLARLGQGALDGSDRR
jgi:hypothetical protein